VAGSNPDAVSFFRADVGLQEDWRKLIETAKSRYGRLDCLVNNAGTTYHNKVSPVFSLFYFAVYIGV